MTRSMPPDIKRNPTYGNLSQALQTLGYVEHRNGTLTLFAHPRTRVDIILPRHRPTSRVDDVHLAAVYHLVGSGGAATRSQLEVALASMAG